MGIVGPLDPELKRLHDDENRRLRELAHRYPRAKTDEFQKSCMSWELFNGGRAIWLIICPRRDIQWTMDSFRDMFGVFSGIKAGLSTSAIANKDGVIVGFQVLCYEKCKDEIRNSLSFLGIEDGEMKWIPEIELRKQFEEWKKNQRSKVRKNRNAERRKASLGKKVHDGRDKEEIDIFKLVVREDQAHASFLSMRDTAGYGEARKLINSLYSRMGDPNGNFISYFQSDNFYSRLFEIACFGYLEECGFTVNRPLEKPDFLATKGEYQVAIEAVTANPTGGLASNIAFQIGEFKPFKEVLNQNVNEFPFRMGSTLLKKLGEKYWDLPQCKNMPLVLIIGSFYEPGATLKIGDSLARYLYGGCDYYPEWVKYNGIYTHVVPIKSFNYSGRTMQANFFAQPMAEHISAVIYSNTFTETIFARRAIQMGWGIKFEATRMGTCLLPEDIVGYTIRKFRYRVLDQDAPSETWALGITIFHNPRAAIPLPANLFDSTMVYKYEDGKLIREVKSFHPLTSFTVISPIENK